jgi:Xaa-Pro aminopeptidase
MLQPQNYQELRSNMLIYIEPVIVDERVGALQLEDLILVKEDGAEILTTYADTEELFVIQ